MVKIILLIVSFGVALNGWSGPACNSAVTSSDIIDKVLQALDETLNQDDDSFTRSLVSNEKVRLCWYDKSGKYPQMQTSTKVTVEELIYDGDAEPKRTAVKDDCKVTLEKYPRQGWTAVFVDCPKLGVDQ